MQGVVVERKHSLLVVDDDESSRDIVRRTLHGEHDVVAVESGTAALSVLRDQPIDLVLLDVMLPNVRGTEICRQVKASERDAYLPVLLVSALDEQESRNQGLAAGADDYISKPFDRQELRLRVKTFLRLRDQDLTIRSQMAEMRKLQELKDELVALIAHDLRNPLMGIQGHLELLQRQARGKEYDSLVPRVTKAIASTDELRRILDGMLDVRLLEEQRLPLELQPTPILAVLESAVATLEGMGLAKQVTLRLTVEGEREARIDPKMTTRAVENLLSNAVRHSKSGSDVDIRACVDANRVVIDVADRGVGVANGLKRSLFQKFGSVAERKEGGSRGYGLGLYLVRLVAEAHGGEVSVADREGGGAVFTLSLPH